MIELNIPGSAPIFLEHLVLDYNGTIAVDGHPIPGVTDQINRLADHLDVHVVTADTRGNVMEVMRKVRCHVAVLPPGNQDTAKQNYIQKLDPPKCVCVGNGRNDRLMLKDAAVGIGVILAEGMCADIVPAADVICTDIRHALGLLEYPLRLVATLRL